MKYFSMFSGIGGFEYGIQKATANEWNCVGYSEIDKYAIQTYNKHYPKHKNYGDANDIRWDTVEDFDLLVGGFPCQAFSIAGKRRGFDDTRGTLFFEIARCLERKQPRMFVIENVKGLLNHNKGETFTTILKTLDELGYDVEWECLNSKHFGVPQNRERVFIIGYLRGTSRRQIFPIRESSEKTIRTVFPNIPEIGEEFRIYKDEGISPTIKGNIRIAIKDKFQKTVYDTEGISPTVREGHGDVVRIFDGYNRKYTKEIGAIRRNMLNSGSLIQINKSKHSTDRLYSVDGIARTIRSGAGGLGAKTGAYFIPKIKVLHRGKHQQDIVYDSSGIMCSLPAGTHGSTPHLTKTQHNGEIRKLTPIECERLQGFPDNWTEEVSNTQRYKQLGNAVTTNVIETIFRKIQNV